MKAEQSHCTNLGFESICVIGLGLIGASFAGAVKEANPAVHVVGVDTDAPTLAIAEEKGWADRALLPTDEALADYLMK